MPRIVVKSLAPELLDDYLALFDGTRLATEEWDGCYCYFYQAPVARPEDWRGGPAVNRAAVAQLIREGRHQGFLAYVDGVPVGWCHAGPRHLIRNIENFLGVPPTERRDIGSILCFVVDQRQRRRGVARALLGAALQHFAAIGLGVAEAYPAKAAGGERQYHGPLALYRETGFTQAGDTEHYLIVRKDLGGMSDE